jgi:YHS domain-containing protein
MSKKALALAIVFAFMLTAVAVMADGKLKPGDKAVDPVDNHEFAVKADTPTTDYQGQTYYFCSAACKEAFDKEPAKYAKKTK